MLAVVVAGMGMTFGMRQVLLSKEDQQLGREVDHELIERPAILNTGRGRSPFSMDLLIEDRLWPSMMAGKSSASSCANAPPAETPTTWAAGMS